MKEEAKARNGNKIKTLLTVTAIFESGTGLVLIALPQLLITLLFGSFTDTVITSTIARVAGVAIFALAIACWVARNDGQSYAARGLVSAMLLYNTAIAIVLVYSATGLSLSGIGLWPVVLLHTAMSAWCIMSLLK
jgi:hypothetical protein